MKRSHTDIGVFTATRSKKPFLMSGLGTHISAPFSVSGTDVRNYMLRDPLVDWLKLTRPTSMKRPPFSTFIMDKGNEFEKTVVDYISQTKLPIVKISTDITPETCTKTIEAMQQGVPIIYSAPFRNDKRHIRGVVDLLVRSDCLRFLVNENPTQISQPETRAPNLPGNYHYVVVDIKFSTLPLRADGIHILNSGAYPAYKSQLWIYTQGIGDIQGYTPRYAYILGRRWTYISKGENFSSLQCLDKLGVIDYEGVDREYQQRTQQAINWLQDLRQNGKSWSLYPPSRPELYPNMCIDSGEWNATKKEIATRLGDITQLWYCGVKQRQIALTHGISSWRDPRCCSKNMGMGGVRAPIIDKIIRINRQEIDKIRPKKILNNIYDWKTACNEMFVDFENFCDVFADFGALPSQPRTDQIFMIGVYYKDSSVYRYKNLVANSVSPDEEYRIMNEFVQFVRQQGNPKLWCWWADQNIWTRTENRQMDLAVEAGNVEKADNIVDNWKLYDWADLYQVFRQEPIVIKDCFKFGLKEIASAMHKHKLITTKLTSGCHSGLDAAVTAWQVYQTGDDPATSPILADIAEYNRFDVTVLQEILAYLRREHTD